MWLCGYTATDTPTYCVADSIKLRSVSEWPGLGISTENSSPFAFISHKMTNVDKLEYDRENMININTEKRPAVHKDANKRRLTWNGR